MSDLSNKIRLIRGKLTAQAAGRLCGLSRESFYRCERGGSVKFDTLKKIAAGFKINDADWLALLVAWLYNEAGADGNRINISLGGKKISRLNRDEDEQIASLIQSFTALNPTERTEVLRALKRKEVIRCLPAINRVWDKLDNDVGRRQTTRARLDE